MGRAEGAIVGDDVLPASARSVGAFGRLDTQLTTINFVYDGQGVLGCEGEGREPALLDLLLACEAEIGAPPPSRTCLALSLLQLPLRAAPRCSHRPCRPRRPDHAKGERGAFARPKGRAACSRSSDRRVADSLLWLPLRAAPHSSASTPPTPSPGSREKRRRRAYLPLLTCCSPRVCAMRWRDFRSLLVLT